MDRTPPCCAQPPAVVAAVYDGYHRHGGTSSTVHTAAAAAAAVDDGQGCFCCDSDDDSVERARVAHAKRKCYKSCARNAFVCALLVSYTFAGALMFLSIEGDADEAAAVAAAADGGTVRIAGLQQPEQQRQQQQQQQNLTAVWLAAAAAGEESRARTVESIWEITVNLNILYRDNWTRLASQELNRFQEDLIRRLTQQMEIESAAVSYHHRRRQQHRDGDDGGDDGDDDDDDGLGVPPPPPPPPPDGQFEWNMATSFLYCLSILTTIGKSNPTVHCIRTKVLFSRKQNVRICHYCNIFLARNTRRCACQCRRLSKNEN